MEDIGASLGALPPVPGSAAPGGTDEYYSVTVGGAAAIIGSSRAESPPPYIPPVAAAAVTTVMTTLSDLTSTTMSNIAISSTGMSFIVKFYLNNNSFARSQLWGKWWAHICIHFNEMGNSVHTFSQSVQLISVFESLLCKLPMSF